MWLKTKFLAHIKSESFSVSDVGGGGRGAEKRRQKSVGETELLGGYKITCGFGQ